MTDKITSSTIISQGGYDSTQNHLLLDNNFPGKASRLVNYEVGLTGGYRKISGFESYDVDYEEVAPATAEGKILGLAIYEETDGDFIIMAARKLQSGNTYNWFYYDSGSGWTGYTTGLTFSSVGVSRIRHAKVNFGGVSYILFVDGTNNLTIFDGTTWYSASDSGAGTSGDSGGDQMINAPSLITVFKNHIFIAGDSSAPSVVVHSAPEDVFDWTAASGGGQLPTGFIINQIKPYREALYIWGLNNISTVTVNNTDFVVNPITVNMGCLAPDSVVEINSDLIFIAPDGIRPISATERIGDIELASVSKPIQDYIKRLISTYPLENLCSVVIREKSQFRYLVSDGTGTDTGSGLIGGLRIPDNQVGWEFSELMGITANVCESDFINGVEVVLHGGYNGGVYKQEEGYSFNGEDIISIYSTPFLTFGDSEIKKELRTINTFFRTEGSMEISLSLDFDWGLTGILEPPSFVLSNTEVVPQYNDGTQYNSGAVYGGGTKSPVIQTNINGSCFSVKFTFTTQDQYPPHSIHGFVTEFTPQGRR